jgi:hypothetical protein
MAYHATSGRGPRGIGGRGGHCLPRIRCAAQVQDGHIGTPVSRNNSLEYSSIHSTDVSMVSKV